MLGRRFTLPGFRVELDAITLADARRRLGCDVVALPATLCILGWDASARRWTVCVGGEAPAPYRLPATLRFLEHRVRPCLAPGTFWFLCCLEDGWGEHLPAGVLEDLSVISSTRSAVACFAARRDDPAAVLLPEAHYLERFHYARFRWEARLRRAQWADRRGKAVFCGAPHGRTISPGPGHDDAPVSRHLLRQVVDAEGLPVRVHLGGGITRAEQSSYKYILDVDGFVRTFDAWAWKLLSGSVVLSQSSPWDTFFTLQFEPWVHFIPVSEDFADLGERLAWCRAHDDECREIASRGQAHAAEVYAPGAVTLRAISTLGTWLDGR